MVGAGCWQAAPPPARDVCPGRRGCWLTERPPRLSPGAHHHPLHRLPGPHLLLLLCVPGREGCRQRVGPGRVWQLRGRPVVGSGKSAPLGRETTAHTGPGQVVGAQRIALGPWGLETCPPCLKPVYKHVIGQAAGPHPGRPEPSCHCRGARDVSTCEAGFVEASLGMEGESARGICWECGCRQPQLLPHPWARAPSTVHPRPSPESPSTPGPASVRLSARPPSIPELRSSSSGGNQSPTTPDQGPWEKGSSPILTGRPAHVSGAGRS